MYVHIMLHFKKRQKQKNSTPTDKKIKLMKNGGLQQIKARLSPIIYSLDKKPSEASFSHMFKYCSLIVLILVWRLSVSHSRSDKNENNHIPWNVDWWNSKSSMSTNPSRATLFHQGVALNIDHPMDGQLIRYIAGYGHTTTSCMDFFSPVII
jgi:hypothetical protein